MLQLTELDEKKRDVFLNSCYSCFAMGYRKGSIQDIARQANVSKSLVFYYFKSKRELYIALFEHAVGTIKNQMNSPDANEETDLFERLKILQTAKFSLIRKYPKIFDFLKSAYFERDDEVSDDIKRLYRGGPAMADALQNIDASKFKDGVDIRMLINIITWCAEGYVASHATGADADISHMTQEFDEYLDLLKRHFYKEA